LRDNFVVQAREVKVKEEKATSNMEKVILDNIKNDMNKEEEKIKKKRKKLKRKYTKS